MIRWFFRHLIALVAIAAVAVACDNSGEELTSSNIKVYNKSVEVAAEGETLRINYGIERVVEGQTLEVTCQAEWVSDIKVYPTFMELTAQRNTSTEERTARLELTYGTDKNYIELV